MTQADGLDAIRREIDKTDEKIVRLLETRMDLVRKVAEYKKKTGVPILDASREKAILDRIMSLVENHEYKEPIKSVYSEILKASREFQAKMMEDLPGGQFPARYGLVGGKLSHSLSPKIHAFLFRELGINGEYGLIEASPGELPGLLGELKAKGYLGVNVTIPYKKDIMAFLDCLSDEANRIGAVNTISLLDRFTGYNTDYDGFGMALEAYGIKAEGARCAVLGSGGAARAVVAYLEDHGASSVTIASRNPESAMVRFPGLKCADILTFEAKGYDIVINATPVGMYPDSYRSPLRKEQLEGAGFIMDLIYNPSKTLLLQYSEELGIPCANGLYMLVAQAFRSEEIWQGRTLDRAIISKIMAIISDVL